MTRGLWSRTRSSVPRVAILLTVLTAGTAACGGSAISSAQSSCSSYGECLTVGAQILKVPRLLAAKDPNLTFTEGFTRPSSAGRAALAAATFVEDASEGQASVTISAQRETIPSCTGAVVTDHPSECAVAAKCAAVVRFFQDGLTYVVAALPPGACVSGFGTAQLPILERVAARMT